MRSDPKFPLNPFRAPSGRTFIPFRLRQEAAPGARWSFAGAPPPGVLPARVWENTRHLATLALEDGLDVSLFSTFDYGPLPGPCHFFSGTYRLHDEASPLVQFVVHPPLPERDTASPLRNELPALGFVFGAPGIDPECPDIGALGNPAIHADHKAGGQPVFSQLEGDAAAALALLRDGYTHLLQLAPPSAADTLIQGDWPFGEAFFHLFARKTGSTYGFRHIWG